MNEQIITIMGLTQWIEKTDYYSTKRPTEKPVLIDKYNWVINSIIINNRHNWSLTDYESVPLNKLILRSQLGQKECDKILFDLEDWNYILIDRSYISANSIAILNQQRRKEGLQPTEKTPQSMKYGLTEKSKKLGVIKVPILSTRMREKFRKHRQDQAQRYILDSTTHQKILNNITQLLFYPDKAASTMEYVQNSTASHDKIRYYHDCYETLIEFNQFTNIEEYFDTTQFYYTQSRKVKRVYHYYTTIPKPFRFCLGSKDGSSISEIDLRNSQPLLIAMRYAEESNSGITSDLVKDVLTGSFYKNVADQALIYGDKEFYELFNDNYSKFKGIVLGQGLYFNLVPLEAIKPAEMYLLNLYPQFIKYIRSRKYKDGYKTVPIKAQILESSIFIEELFTRLDKDRFAIPIHDSIMVKTDEVEYFLKALTDIFLLKFPYLGSEQIIKLFSITKYE